MISRILMVALAATALTLTGCNKSGDTEAEDTTVETVETTTVEDAPANAAAQPDPATTPPADTAAATPADPAAAPAADPAAAAAPAGGEVTLPSGTTYVDTQVGTGTEAVVGQTVSVHYTGTLTDGTKFDSSLDRGRPFQFTLGEGRVIKGWEEGIAGMRVGGKRTLTVPPTAGYGDQQMGPIPPNSTLLFDVELLGVQ